MQAHAKADWLDAGATLAAEELWRACRITIEDLNEMVSYGALEPVRYGQMRRFGADQLMPAGEAMRVRRDFDLDPFVACLIPEHLHRIAALEQEARSLRARLTS